MTLLQTILFAMLYWLAVGEIFIPFTYCFCDLMFILLLTGTILEDPVKGCIVGGTIQPLCLALTAVRGVMPVDREAAGIVTTAMVMAAGISLDQDLMISSAATLIMAQLHTVKHLAMAWTVHHADRVMETGNVKGLTRTSLFCGPLTCAVIFLMPVTIVLKYGVNSLGVLMNGLPGWANSVFSLAGGLLPTLGFAMIILVIGKGQLIPSFIAGFFFAQYSGLGAVPGCLLGISIAWLYTIFTKKETDNGSLFADLLGFKNAGSKATHTLSRKTLKKVWLSWRLHIYHVNNVGRLQATGMCLTMAPALGELYPDDKEEQVKGSKRHMQLFITENMIGDIIPGIITSLEEQRAIQERDQVPEDQLISEGLVNDVKDGMIGPFADVDDTLNYTTLRPLIPTFFMGFAQQGMLWVPIVDDTLLYVIFVSEGKLMFNTGCELGADSAMNILRNNAMQKTVAFFSIVGSFVMGTMATQNVSVVAICEIPYGTEDMISIRELLFNPIVPGILSLLTVFGVYAYLRKGDTMLKVALVLLVIAIALGDLGTLGV